MSAGCTCSNVPHRQTYGISRDASEDKRVRQGPWPNDEAEGEYHELASILDYLKDKHI